MCLLKVLFHEETSCTAESITCACGKIDSEHKPVLVRCVHWSYFTSLYM